MLRNEEIGLKVRYMILMKDMRQFSNIELRRKETRLKKHSKEKGTTYININPIVDHTSLPQEEFI